MITQMIMLSILLTLIIFVILFYSSLCLFINNNDVATHTHEHKHIPKYKWNTHIQKSHLPNQTTTQPYFRTVHEFP